jgi:hypothetical protein
MNSFPLQYLSKISYIPNKNGKYKISKRSRYPSQKFKTRKNIQSFRWAISKPSSTHNKTVKLFFKNNFMKRSDKLAQDYYPLFDTKTHVIHQLNKRNYHFHNKTMKLKHNNDSNLSYHNNSQPLLIKNKRSVFFPFHNKTMKLSYKNYQPDSQESNENTKILKRTISSNSRKYNKKHFMRFSPRNIEPPFRQKEIPFSQESSDPSSHYIPETSQNQLPPESPEENITIPLESKEESSYEIPSSLLTSETDEKRPESTNTDVESVEKTI